MKEERAVLLVKLLYAVVFLCGKFLCPITSWILCALIGTTNVRLCTEVAICLSSLSVFSYFLWLFPMHMRVYKISGLAFSVLMGVVYVYSTLWFLVSLFKLIINLF